MKGTETRSLSALPLAAAGLRRLREEPPKGVDNSRFVQALADAEAFLARWGAQAEAMGWQPDDLFGLHPVAPLCRYDAMGLVWMLRGREVIALTDKTATIRASSGAALTYRRGVNP